ncbi:immunoglobulin superfamily member 3-like isoform X1 [Electrophorus electricus]|uniref:immunoglobulin superfamily member 3-like isoform X1 n=1 Tax=Electrophorus electricus TaxID=8005 RepID=UPI0015D0C1C4|nr:immunoglobulin superfamily member 3-like isoform X1 [Electrophorus electricus]
MTEFIVPILFYITLNTAFAENIFQMEPLLMAEIGSNTNLTCFCAKEQYTGVMWFKQEMGEKPIGIATSYHYSHPPEFYKDFDKNRFRLSRDVKSFNLSISETQLSDSATYYCAVAFINMITFGDGTILIVKGKDHHNHVVQQQPTSMLHQPAENINLECKIFSNVSMGNHSVYWFKHGSRESHPGIIYTHGDSAQCKKSSEAGAPTQSCVYMLPKRNLRLSDAGTYYCAVTACGQILIGNGTKLEIYDASSDQRTWFLIISISVLLLLSLTVNITLCIRIQRGQWNSEGNKQAPTKIRNNIPSEQANDDSNLNYATIKFIDKGMNPRRKTNINIEDQTVYYNGLNMQSSISKRQTAL